MKNTTKKILSMLLVMIMLLSVMSLSFTASAKVTSKEAIEFLEAYWKADIYSINIYKVDAVNPDTLRHELNDIMLEAIYEAEKCLPVDKTRFYDYEFLTDSANAYALVEAKEIFEAVIPKLEAHIESRGAVLVLDLYEYAYKLPSFDIIYPSEKLEALYDSEKFNENSQKFLVTIGKEIGDYINNAYYNLTANQAEFDALVKNAYPFFEKIYNCLDGNHLYGEYISNNDTTEEADGTKTATCEFCGATDTVVDEDSKLDSDDNDDNNCSCNCHKKGFSAFIWKILCFFYKIFGMNRTCACGVAHY